MRRLFLLIVLVGLAVPVVAQRENTFYVKQYATAGVRDVGAMTAAAQASCNANTAVPCVLIFDPTLAAYPAGTMPARCAQCIWIDYRSGAPAISAADVADVRTYGARLASTDNASAINAAVGAVSSAGGGVVYIPSGGGSCYQTRAAVNFANNVTYRGAAGSWDGHGGSCIEPHASGQWGMANPNQAVGVKGVVVENLTVHIPAGLGVTGGMDFTAVGVSRASSPRVVIDGDLSFGFKFGDPSVVWGYVNDLHNPWVYCSNGGNNSNVGFWFANTGNDNHLQGGGSQSCGIPVRADTVNNVSFFGTMFENFQAHGAVLNTSAGFGFYNTRCENTTKTPASLVRAGGVVTATFAGAGHGFNSASDWTAGAIQVFNSTATTNAFNGVFDAITNGVVIVDATHLRWNQAGADETATAAGSMVYGDCAWVKSGATRNFLDNPYASGVARVVTDQSTTTAAMYQNSSGGVLQLPGANGGGVVSVCMGLGGCTPTTGDIFVMPGGAAWFEIRGVGGNRGYRMTTTGGAAQIAALAEDGGHGALELGASLTSGPSIRLGAGAPSTSICTASNIGSLYINTSGGAATTFYVCTAAATWTAK